MPREYPHTLPPGNAKVWLEIDRLGYRRLRWTVDGRQASILEHLSIWIKAKGPIPIGHLIHHIDRNPGNNDIGNLQLMTYSDHQRLHATRHGMSYTREYARAVYVRRRIRLKSDPERYAESKRRDAERMRARRKAKRIA